jgi:hypothetical protein
MDGIQPRNAAALERLAAQIKAEKRGSPFAKAAPFTAADWTKLTGTPGCQFPAWYQSFSQQFPLASLALEVPWERGRYNWTSCMILPTEALEFYGNNDWFFADRPFPSFVQFGEAWEFGGPARWLIPVANDAEPIVHTFSDGDTAPLSTGLRFDDFVLKCKLYDAAAHVIIPNEAARAAAEIIIPEVKFENTTLQQAVDMLNELAKVHDPREIGITIEVTPAALEQTEVILDIAPKENNLSELVRSVALLNDLSFEQTETGYRITTMSGK